MKKIMTHEQLIEVGFDCSYTPEPVYTFHGGLIVLEHKKARDITPEELLQKAYADGYTDAVQDFENRLKTMIKGENSNY